MRFRAFVAVAVVCLAVTSCRGGGKDDSKKSKTTVPTYVAKETTAISEGTGACGLLTQAEVSSALGLPADPGKGVATPTSGSCSWAVRTTPGQFVGVLTQAPGGDPYQQTLSTAPKPVEPLPGVGDAAFVTNETVWAFKGPVAVAVTVVTPQPLAQRKPIATKLAQMAIARA